MYKSNLPIATIGFWLSSWYYFPQIRLAIFPPSGRGIACQSRLELSHWLEHPSVGLDLWFFWTNFVSFSTKSWEIFGCMCFSRVNLAKIYNFWEIFLFFTLFFYKKFWDKNSVLKSRPSVGLSFTFMKNLQFQFKKINENSPSSGSSFPQKQNQELGFEFGSSKWKSNLILDPVVTNLDQN